MRYLIKITPLEPYTFGDDRGFKYKDEKGTGKESYLMRSRELPEQTAILGILRYIILRQEGVLRTDFRYTRDERERIKEYIGGRSFSFMDKDELDFGLIKCISPVFITNEAEQILIKNPYNNKASKEGYDPIKMSPVTFKTRFGDIFLPDNGEYNAKKGYGFGFYNINTHKIHTDLFTSRFTAGNKKDNPDSKKKDGFFRREIYILKEGYSFAVYADIDIDELPKTTIGYMGKKKNAFKIEIIKKAYTDKLEDMVSK